MQDKKEKIEYPPNRATYRKAMRAGKLKNGRKKQYQYIKGFKAK